jgi:hypothetical protein
MVRARRWRLPIDTRKLENDGIEFKAGGQLSGAHEKGLGQVQGHRLPITSLYRVFFLIFPIVSCNCPWPGVWGLLCWVQGAASPGLQLLLESPPRRVIRRLHLIKLPRMKHHAVLIHGLPGHHLSLEFVPYLPLEFLDQNV